MTGNTETIGPGVKIWRFRTHPNWDHTGTDRDYQIGDLSNSEDVIFNRDTALHRYHLADGLNLI